MPISTEDNLFGRLALHYKLVTREQINEALRQQGREGGDRKIGEILIERGWLSRERFQQLLEIQRQVQARDSAAAPAPQPPTPSPTPVPPPPPAPAVEVEAVPEAAAAVEAEPTVEAESEAAPTVEPEPAPKAEPTAPTGPASLAGWLALAADRGASDLHIHAGQAVRMRIHGELTEASDGPLDREHTEAILRDALDPEERETLDATGQVDLARTVPQVGRLRGNVYRQQHGLDGVFRLIPATPPSLSDLGLPLDLARLANYHQGLVLVTGPAGCGKSATLAALVNIVNSERSHHVITIEDPVETVHRSDHSIINQRQVGRHTSSFARALRAALREDPDVIVVGELRDLETISLALTAAETGHLVLATLHTTSAISTINRLVGVFPPNQQPQIRTMAAESLRAVVCQRLVPRADGDGRVPALEILLVTKAVSNLIRDNKTFQIRSVLQTNVSRGMRELDASLEELVSNGTITREEARRQAESPDRFAPKPAAGQSGGGSSR